MGAWTRRRVLHAGAAVVSAPRLLACTADDDPIADTDVVESDAPIDTAPPVDSDVPSRVVTFDASQISADDAVFPEAVRAGSMRRASAIVITRAVSAALVRLRVWRDLGEGEVDLAYDADVTPNDGGYCRVVVEGLAAGLVWRYAFFTGSPDAFTGRSDIGRFRTAPAGGTTPPLTLALCACSGDAKGRNDVVGRLADHDEIDAIAHVGDLAYNDGADNLPAYRASWASWMTSPGYRAGLGSAGMYATWDDHEIDNAWNGETVDPARRAAAYAAWTENVPVDTTPDRVWGSFLWGRTAELLVLDCRGERKPSTRKEEGVYLSRAQMDWLKDRLLRSKAKYKVIFNSVPITNMPTLWDVYAVDRWEGYPPARDELLSFIQDNDLKDVWFLSGDFHVCFLGKVEPSGQGALANLWEVTATSGNTNFLGDNLDGPQFSYGTSQPRVTLVTFDPDAGVRVRFIDPVGGAADFEATVRS